MHYRFATQVRDSLIMNALPSMEISVIKTSEFQSATIYETLNRIGSPEKPLYLPAIQRHFVWNRNDICKLFDSIMCGYPIGTFLFWEIADTKSDNYAFYEFNKDYSEHVEGKFNKTAPRSLPPGITGVLDGQQRLNSMYVALSGSYSAYNGGKGLPRSNKNNYSRRWLYINVLFERSEEEEADYQYEFTFLTDPEAEPKHFERKKCWVPVHKVYRCETVEDLDKYWEDFQSGIPADRLPPAVKRERAQELLKLLRQRLRVENLISYFPITNTELTEALEIFIRANNGGIKVTNAEMIFSTIIAHWDKGREKIEALESELNRVGNGFSFDVGAVMLGCLALSGSPIRLKIESFKPGQVDVIKKGWDGIAESLRTATQLFEEWGFSGNNRVTASAVIAIAILVQRKINLKASNPDLRLFVIRSLIFQIYRRGERALTLIRGYAHDDLTDGAIFDLKKFAAKFITPSGEKMEATPDMINKLLMLPISDNRIFLLLSLLHTHHAIHQKAFQKDHIHPLKGFESLDAFELNTEQAEKWNVWKNQLPNLQLLQDGENNNKRATPFEEWLPKYRTTEALRKSYLAENDIPLEVSLDFNDFEVFFEERKKILRQRLTTLLDVKEQANMERQ